MILPSQIGRRAFVTNAGVSLGSMVLGAWLSAPKVAAAAETAKAAQLDGEPCASAPGSEGQADHLALHGRRHEPSRHVRSQAAFGTTRRRADAGFGHQRTADRPVAGEEASSLPHRSTASANGATRGRSISVIWPELASKCADELCIVRSLFTDAINHDPAHTFMNTGSMVAGRPAMGSWLWYGLGNDAEALPGFVVMVSTGNYGQKQPIAARQWHSGFLPSRFQGVEFHSAGDPVLYVRSPAGISRERQRDFVDAVEALNGLRNAAQPDPEIATRISQYEMAFQMQTSVPELMDVRNEPKHILDLYGTKGGDGTFAANCLLARRLAERGVRFIQLYHRDWDHHGVLKEHIKGTAAEVDRGAAALLIDLKQRGMLDDTIVVFGSEFGRTPMAQGSGRDHHLAGFTMWFAGGGFKRGFTTARPTNSVITPPKIAHRCTTSTPRCSRNWASNTCTSRSRAKVSTRS